MGVNDLTRNSTDIHKPHIFGFTKIETMKYKVYFEIFGKKLVKEIEANSPYAAICQIENEKPKIIKTVEKDPLENLKEDDAVQAFRDMFGI